MVHLYVNNLNVTLGTTINNVATTFPVSTTAGFPPLVNGAWFYMTITAPFGSSEALWEIIKVTSHSNDSITCVRGQGNTTPKIWDINSTVSCRITAEDMQILENFKDTKGLPNGLASLDSTGKISSTQIPTVMRADELKTPRSITLVGNVSGAVTFDGSTNVSMTTTVGDNSHNHSTSTITGWPVGTTMTDLSFISGTSSNVQTQLNNRAATNHTHTIAGLTDVNINSITTNDTLRFNGTSWVNSQTPAGSHGALSNLGNDDHIQYLNNTRGDARYLRLDAKAQDSDKLNGLSSSDFSLTSHEHLLNNLSDVVITSAVTDQIIKYNGTDWVNSNLVTPAHGTLVGLNNDDHPQYLTTGRGDIRYLVVEGKAADSDKLDGIGSSGFSLVNHTHTISNIGGISITNPTNGQILNYNGSNWVNTDAPTQITVHNQLSGLNNDDHPQYHNNIRGDARYLGITAVAQDSNRLSGLNSSTTATANTIVSRDALGDILGNRFFAQQLAGITGYLFNSNTGMSSPSVDTINFHTDTQNIFSLTTSSIIANRELVLNTNLRERTVSYSSTSPTITSANGTIQTWALTGNSTPTISLIAGQSITLTISAGVNTITWPTIVWVGGTAPIISTTKKTVIILWHDGVAINGLKVGELG